MFRCLNRCIAGLKSDFPDQSPAVNRIIAQAKPGDAPKAQLFLLKGADIDSIKFDRVGAKL